MKSKPAFTLYIKIPQFQSFPTASKCGWGKSSINFSDGKFFQGMFQIGKTWLIYKHELNWLIIQVSDDLSLFTTGDERKTVADSKLIESDLL